MKYLTIVFFCASVAMISALDDKLKITILFESLCPDSVKFMQNELSPSYQYIKDYVDIEFVPFGKSNSSDDGNKFVCQHGDDECAGNRMQSCVLSELKSQDDKVKFIVCQMMSTDKIDKSGKTCAKLINMNFEPVEKCIATDLGKNLQLKAETVTKSYNPVFIPTIIYDKEFNQKKQDRSRSEFLLVACEHLKTKGLLENNPKLEKCSELCA